MTDPVLRAAPLDDPQPVLGGTMRLMTRFGEAPCPALARRIADHLELLASHPSSGDLLRRMCTTMRAQWAAQCILAQLSTGQGLEDGRRACEPTAPAPRRPARLH
jgi:hypothetical protein